jgi:Phage integrase family
MLESTNHASIVSIYGGNAEIDLLNLGVGQFVDEARAGKARMETAAQGIFVKAPIIIVIGSYPRAAKEECQTCPCSPPLAFVKYRISVCRHATGFALGNKGTDTRTLQAYLGHRSIQSTVRYTELAPGRFKNLWR